jgi:hypothetical protein
MIASRERRECEVTMADSQSPAWTGMLPYGVEGERADRREVRSVLSSRIRLCIARWKEGAAVRTNVLTRPVPSL